MKNYHVTFYFSSNLKYEIYVPSELELNDFVEKFNNDIQMKNPQFVNFIGDENKASVNLDNVLFYTIDKFRKKV